MLERMLAWTERNYLAATGVVLAILAAAMVAVLWQVANAAGVSP